MSTVAPLPILTFHSLDDGTSIISFAPRAFRRGMAKICERQYQTLRLLEAVDYINRNEPFPERSCVITFDDGYKTVYDEAFPILQHYGIKATVFLTVGERGKMKSTGRLPPLNGRSMLNWHEINEMRRWGIDFGAHTLTHPDLTCLSPDQIEAEICESKKIIEDALGTHVACFAYPYGRYDNRSYKVVRQHFACACSDKLGLVTPDSDPYALERIDAAYLRTDWLFDMMLTKLFPWYIRLRSIPHRVRRVVQLNLGW